MSEVKNKFKDVIRDIYINEVPESVKGKNYILGTCSAILDDGTGDISVQGNDGVVYTAFPKYPTTIGQVVVLVTDGKNNYSAIPIGRETRVPDLIHPPYFSGGTSIARIATIYNQTNGTTGPLPLPPSSYQSIDFQDEGDPNIYRLTWPDLDNTWGVYPTNSINYSATVTGPVSLQYFPNIAFSPDKTRVAILLSTFTSTFAVPGNKATPMPPPITVPLAGTLTATIQPAALWKIRLYRIGKHMQSKGTIDATNHVFKLDATLEQEITYNEEIWYSWTYQGKALLPEGGQSAWNPTTEKVFPMNLFVTQGDGGYHVYWLDLWGYNASGVSDTYQDNLFPTTYPFLPSNPLFAPPWPQGASWPESSGPVFIKGNPLPLPSYPGTLAPNFQTLVCKLVNGSRKVLWQILNQREIFPSPQTGAPGQQVITSFGHSIVDVTEDNKGNTLDVMVLVEKPIGSDVGTTLPNGYPKAMAIMKMSDNSFIFSYTLVQSGFDPTGFQQPQIYVPVQPQVFAWTSPHLTDVNVATFTQVSTVRSPQYTTGAIAIIDNTGVVLGGFIFTSTLEIIAVNKSTKEITTYNLLNRLIPPFLNPPHSVDWWPLAVTAPKEGVLVQFSTTNNPPIASGPPYFTGQLYKYKIVNGVITLGDVINNFTPLISDVTQLKSEDVASRFLNLIGGFPLNNAPPYNYMTYGQ